MSPVIQQLLKAKKHSDRSEYEQKKAILRKLLESHPHQFKIDSRQSHTVGLTHLPSKFKIHTVKSSLPDEFLKRQMLKAAFLKLIPAL